MKKSIFHIILLILLAAINCYSQLRVVKDNIACLYGLKNENGEWVVPAEYTSIDQSCNNGYCFYSCHKNYQYGIISMEGKLIIPPMYESCNNYGTHGPGKFSVRTKTGIGIVNSQNKFLIEPDYISLQHIDNGVYLYSEKGKKYGLRDTAKIICEEKFYYPDFEQFRDETVIKFFISGKKRRLYAGLINTRLDTLIPPIYDEIYVYDNLIKVYRKDAYGFYNSDLQPVIPAEYDDFISPSHDYYHSRQTIAMLKNGKWGLMSTEGKIYLPPQFDSIRRELFYKSSQWIYTINKLDGLVDDSGEFITPPLYKLTEINYRYDSWKGYFASLGDKTGVMQKDGSFLIPPEYKSFTQYNTNQTFFYNEKLALLFNYSVITGKEVNPHFTPEIDTCKIVFENNKWILYVFNNKYYPLLKKKSGDSTLLQYETNAYVTPQYFGYTLFYNSKNESYDFNGKVIHRKLDNKIVYKITDNNFYLYTASNGKFGAIDADANLLLDTVYYKIHHAWDDLLWIKFKKDNGCDAYKETKIEEQCGWYLCDLTAKKVIDTEFDLPGNYYKQIQPVRINNKTGLFDFKKLQFLIPPIYQNIGGIDQAYYSGNFHVATDSSFFKIYDINGNSLSEEKWNNILPLNYPVSFTAVVSDSGNYHSTAISAYLLLNNSDTLLISYNGDTCSNRKTIQQMIYGASLRIQGQKYIHSNRGTRFTVYQNSVDSIQLLFIHKVIDHCFRKYGHRYLYPPREIKFFYYTTEKCNYITYDSYSKNETPEYFKDDFSITFVNENAASMLREYDAGYWYGNDDYLNFYKYGNEVKEITIDSLFAKHVNVGETMEFLISEAVTLDDNVELDCSKPGSFFEQTRHQFLMNTEGITIELIDSYNNEVHFLIPWKKLQKYAPEKGIVADFLNAGKK